MDGHKHVFLMKPGAYQLLELQKMHALTYDVWQTNFMNYLVPMLPPGWRITAMEQNSVPYGRKISVGENAGLMAVFVGEKHAPLAMSGIKGLESFILWFMPLPYRGVTNPTWNTAPASVLGWGENYVAYAFDVSTETPTWRDWKSEMKKLLKLR
ncbi:MAG: hypothetical protein V1746_06455 [bacterium]